MGGLSYDIWNKQQQCIELFYISCYYRCLLLFPGDPWSSLLGIQLLRVGIKSVFNIKRFSPSLSPQHEHKAWEKGTFETNKATGVVPDNMNDPGSWMDFPISKKGGEDKLDNNKNATVEQQPCDPLIFTKISTWGGYFLPTSI